MTIHFKKILSIPQDGASSSLLIIQQRHKILLDCGISNTFDISKYKQHINDLKDVKIVLISHSSLQYSGAYPFLVSQLKLQPKIVYTTQPIMRYSPLNIHEQLLNYRIENYNRKIFNRIYTFYQEINLVKPHQKKSVQLQKDNSQSKDKIIQNQHHQARGCSNIQFTCYLAGGSLGSLYWRISYGLVNIMYIVQYNNYAMNHISGMDVQNLMSQPTNLLVTDGYRRTQTFQKNEFYNDVKQILMDFYNKNKIQVQKPKLFNPQSDQQLLIVCYPSEIIIQVIFILGKIINQLYQSNIFQRIGVIHLSSRYLELVKSQSQFFTSQFKSMLEKMGQFFQQTTFIKHRVNVCSIHSTLGALAQQQKNVKVISIGTSPVPAPTLSQLNRVSQKLKSYNIFTQQQERVPRSTTKLSMSRIQSKLSQHQMDIEHPKIEQSSIKDEQQQINEQNDDILKDNFNKKNFNNKYIAHISGIPRFNFNTKQKNEEITQYGLRHHLSQGRNAVKTIYDFDDQNKPLTFQEKMLSKKQSKVEVMNISFDLPEPSSYKPLQYTQFNSKNRRCYQTQYKSSIRVINMVKPKDIIMINLQERNLFQIYQKGVNKTEYKINLHNSAEKDNIFLGYQNQLLVHKMNYLPETQIHKVQKVKGSIVKQNGSNVVQIHLGCIGNDQIVNFKLQQLYAQLSKKMICSFMGHGITADGVEIYRRGNYIVLQGNYSEEYFKIRKALYQFVGHI